ncbi:hypothetical protein SAMN06265173_10413 [Thalassovita litoralis]|uniref:Secreted protein n=1 Tax=Thalassovita litoralis TaxID=1010611 RepID=A0A521BRZ1_9RHOB|nr:hypothetical protein [Thalassovita litoralis]SMO49825.1 hypothetical protein SAMN06265173_10413 [Thalassovita litoralis]
MTFRLIFAVLALVALPSVSMGQSQQTYPVPNLAGVWRCVSNSPVVSIDLYLQVYPNQQLQGQGSIVYAGTGRIYNVQGGGAWSVSPPDPQETQWLIRFQLMPQNHAVFSIFARPTGDPNGLYNMFYHPQTGETVETSCARIG